MKTNQSTSQIMPPDLILAQDHIYTPCGLSIKNFIKDKESQDYGACGFDLNDKHIKYRVAKITPTKIGQFVTLWKRMNKGPIKPYDSTDKIDTFIISVRTNQNFGQFIFPMSVLVDKGIIAKNGIGGKRAMRVYPSWDMVESAQAKRTQTWQIQYFFKCEANKTFDETFVKNLIAT